MRRDFAWVVGLVVVAGLGLSGIASAVNTQKITGKFTPSKVPQQKRIAGKLTLVATTGCAPGCSGPGAIKPMTRAQLFIDDDIRFFTRGLPVCQPSKIDAEGTSTEQAKSACGKAQVGTGLGTVAIAGDPGGAEAHAILTVFNGPRQGGKPTMVMHSWDEAFRFSAVFTAVLSRIPGDLGWRLNLAVPELPGGSALKEFEFSLRKGYRFRGQRRSYVSTRCGDRNSRWNFKGVFSYRGDPSRTASSAQACQIDRF